MALLILMLKTTILPEKLTSKRLGVGDNKVNGFGVDNNKEIAKKSGKLSKTRKLAKSGKKLSKSENSPNFGIIEAESKFLTLNAKMFLTAYG